MPDPNAGIQPYEAARDGAAIVELWRTTVGHIWPLSAARIHQLLADPATRQGAHRPFPWSDALRWSEDKPLPWPPVRPLPRGEDRPALHLRPRPQHFVLWDGGELIGFVATFIGHHSSNRVGHLALLLITPQRQRQGIGTGLYQAAMKHLHDANVHSIQVGSISPRFWCGVPGNLPGAMVFFRKQGWELHSPVYDLVQDISSFVTPPEIRQRMARERIDIAEATAANVQDVLTFEAQEFPNWLRHYAYNAQLGDYQDLLVARDHNYRVVGTLILYSPHSHPERTDVIWQDLLGKDAGAIGAVGVAESERGRGIGIALVAYGSELLRQRSVRNCYIDWVEITDFYAKLGYQKWREYYPGWREV